MIRNNLFYKLLAVGVAIGLWTYVNSEQNPHARKTITTPLKVRNLAKGYAAEPAVREVNVTIEGLKALVDGVRKEDVTSWVDLSGMKTDKSVMSATSEVKTRVAGVPQEDLNLSVSPKSVRVRVEALSGKRLPVEVKFLAAPPLGYAYSDPVITPASVGVSGKISEVLKVRRVMLPLMGANPNRPIDGRFSVVPVDAKGSVVSGVTLDVDKVRLRLGFVEVPATKAVIVSQNIVGQPRFPARVTGVSIVPSSITLEGRPSALMAISTVSTDPVSIGDATSTVTREVGLRVPRGVRVVGAGKVRVTVHLSETEHGTGDRE
jgi:YbbR domain-containing protein